MDSKGITLFKDFLERDTLFYAVLAVICLFNIACAIWNNYWTDIDTCYWERTGHIIAGEVPYRDFVYEYPPLSIPFMLIPRLLSWDLMSFHIIYMVFSSAAFILSAMVLDRISSRFIGAKYGTRLLMLLALMFLNLFILQRNDIFPILMILLSLWMYLEKRYELAIFIMALAGMTKLYPMLFLVPMMLPFLMRLDWRMMLKGVMIVGLVFLVSELPFLIVDPSTALDYLSYHSDRGLQVESVLSSFIMLASLFSDLGLQVVFNYGSDNLVGALPDAIAPYMNMLMMAMLVLSGLISIWLYRRKDLGDREGPVMAVLCIVLLMVFIAFSKVFSTQYAFWVLTMVPFAFIRGLSTAHRKEICIVTAVYLLFSYLAMVTYFDMIVFDPLAIVLSFLKNVSFLLLMAEIVHLFWTEMVRKEGDTDRGLFIRG